MAVEAKPRVLVTGGSGFLGVNLIRFFLARGYGVKNIDFVPFTYEDCKDQIRMVDGDIRDMEQVRTAMEGAEMVVHCAAALPLYKEEDIFSTDVEGTRNVLTAAREAGVSRFVHISSTAVYGVPERHPLYETDPLVGVGPYGKAKIQAEEVCEEFRHAGMILSVIRPKSFIGPERLGVFALLYDWAHTGHNFPLLGGGNNLYQFLDVEDLCGAIESCLILPGEKVNSVFNIGAEVFGTLRDDFQAVLYEAGKGKHIVSIPVGPALGVLRLLEKFGLSPLYEWIYDTAYRESFVSIDRAKEMLGYAPRYSNQEALIRNYRWYVEHLKDFQHASGVSHRVPWKQGLLRMGKWFF